MLHRIFALDTTFYHFATMVERLISVRQFQTGWGPVSLRSKRHLGEWGHFLKVWIWEEDSQPDFAFEVNPISPDRISVTAICHNEPYEPTFDELLAAIEAQWGAPLGLRQDQDTVMPEQAEPEANATAPVQDSPKGLAMNIGTSSKVAEALLLVRDGMPKTTACDFAGVHVRTYNRWQDHPDVMRALEQIIADQPSRVAQALSLIEDGAAKVAACHLARVSIETFDQWKDRPDVAQALRQLKANRPP